MSEARPISVCFSEVKFLKTRKVVQLIFEGPLEEADNLLSALGGVPQTSSSRWCGVVLLDMKQNGGEQKLNDPPARRHFDSLPLGSQAALMCKEPSFWTFISEHTSAHLETEEEAAIWLREYCGVASRSEIAHDPDIAHKFSKLRDAYQTWKLVP